MLPKIIFYSQCSTFCLFVIEIETSVSFLCHLLCFKLVLKSLFVESKYASLWFFTFKLFIFTTVWNQKKKELDGVKN